VKRFIALAAAVLTLMGVAVLALAVRAPVAQAATGSCTVPVGGSSCTVTINGNSHECRPSTGIIPVLVATSCTFNDNNNNDRDRNRRDGRWDYNRDCRDDRQFRTSRADVTRWCDDWDRGHRPSTRPTTTTETTTTTAPAPAPNVIVVPGPSSSSSGGYSNSVPRGSVNTGGLDRAHAA
jgi:hypothetical protein